MSAPTQEARIILAIKAINSSKKTSIRAAAKAYGVPRGTLVDRMKGCASKSEKRNARHKLDPSEEETLIQYVLDLDARGFPPRIAGVKDMADLLLKTRRVKPTGIQWGYRFVQRCPRLKTRLSRAYDKQRAL